jgi:hypothetical protein
MSTATLPIEKPKLSATDELLEKLAERLPDESETVGTMERAVCVNVSLNAWRVGKKIKEAEVEYVGKHKPDRKLVGSRKKIFQSEELEEIAALDAGIYKHLKALSMPSSKRIAILKSGIYVIPATRFEELDEWLKEKRHERAAWVRRLVIKFEENKQRMKADGDHGGLGDLYDDADYPTPEALTKAFEMSHAFFMFDAPTSLRRISVTLFEEQRQALQVEWRNALEEWNDLLLEQAKQLLDKMNEQLEPGDNGRPKRLTTAWGKKMLEFVDAFGEKNLADNKALGDTLDEIRKLVNNTDAKEVRKRPDVYNEIRQTFGTLRERVGGMVTERRRMIRFRGDPVPDKSAESVDDGDGESDSESETE